MLNYSIYSTKINIDFNIFVYCTFQINWFCFPLFHFECDSEIFFPKTYNQVYVSGLKNL